jgi:hypothetical protein
VGCFIITFLTRGNPTRVMLSDVNIYRYYIILSGNIAGTGPDERPFIVIGAVKEQADMQALAAGRHVAEAVLRVQRQLVLLFLAVLEIHVGLHLVRRCG